MPALSPDDVDAFLAEPGHLARIGTVDDDGMPRHQVIMFQQIAPTSAPAHTATPAPPIGTEMMSPPMVCATRTPTNPPTRFITAARPKAMRGVSARVDTEVAMALAASWKPLV